MLLQKLRMPQLEKVSLIMYHEYQVMLPDRKFVVGCRHK